MALEYIHECSTMMQLGCHPLWCHELMDLLAIGFHKLDHKKDLLLPVAYFLHKKYLACHWYTSDASECETYPRNTPICMGRQELVLVCKELSAMQQPTRECTESIWSAATIKVTQTQSTEYRGYPNIMWTKQTTPNWNLQPGGVWLAFDWNTKKRKWVRGHTRHWQRMTN